MVPILEHNTKMKHYVYTIFWAACPINFQILWDLNNISLIPLIHPEKCWSCQQIIISDIILVNKFEWIRGKTIWYTLLCIFRLGYFWNLRVNKKESNSKISSIWYLFLFDLNPHIWSNNIEWPKIEPYISIIWRVRLFFLIKIVL